MALTDMVICPQLGHVNAGYEIIAAIPRGDDEYIVMGVHSNGYYVTWRTWLNDFYSANYFHGADAGVKALADMINRATR
jgi:hypothetical protein